MSCPVPCLQSSSLRLWDLWELLWTPSFLSALPVRSQLPPQAVPHPKGNSEKKRGAPGSLLAVPLPSLGEPEALQLRRQEHWEENKARVTAEHSTLGLCIPRPTVAPSKLLGAEGGSGGCLEPQVPGNLRQEAHLSQEFKTSLDSVIKPYVQNKTNK